MSFRSKLLLAMMLVVGGVTAATLFATQRKVQAGYAKILDQQFQSEIDHFARLQELRLAKTRADTLAFTINVRVIAAMQEFDSAADKEAAEDAYVNLRNELFKPGASIVPRDSGAFVRIMDQRGNVIALAGSSERETNIVAEPRNIDTQAAMLSKAISVREQQQLGYLAPADSQGAPRLHEVVFTKIVDPTDNLILGALILGIPISSELESARKTSIQSGILVHGQLHSRSIDPKIGAEIGKQVASRLSAGNQGQFPFPVGGAQNMVHYRLLNPDSHFPPAYQVAVQSLDEAARVQRELRRQILAFGALALFVALALSMKISAGLSGPINELVRGTREVESGNFAIRVPVRSKDEVGRLTQSFNQMTEGLALKEKYRSVLDLVADKRIAEDLINGRIELGGEEREISVLFCDIRGFTALTQNMEPREVITMLNEHFTPLTRVVYEHHGVVDKFVGDLIMAIFGAPTSSGNDALLAAQCALRMIEERQKLSETSKYKIAMGIGVASGKATAGRMGSADRLSYTVLGARVNLAARLCSQAGRNEVVIDQKTYEVCRDLATVEPLPELRLKGFSEPVHAFKLKALRSP